MGIPKGTKIIVNADTNIRDVIPGKTYITQGGLPDLEGATIVKESQTIGYLERNQFRLEHEIETESNVTNGSSRGCDKLSKYFVPE